MTTCPPMRRDFLRGVAMAGALSAVVPRRAAAALPDPGRLRQWLQPPEGGRPRFLMMRHAQTEAGTGDPPGYRLSDCATQRNLSEAGRQQARALGALLQQAQVQEKKQQEPPLPVLLLAQVLVLEELNKKTEDQWLCLDSCKKYHLHLNKQHKQNRL